MYMHKHKHMQTHTHTPTVSVSQSVTLASDVLIKSKTKALSSCKSPKVMRCVCTLDHECIFKVLVHTQTQAGTHTHIKTPSEAWTHWSLDTHTNKLVCNPTCTHTYMCVHTHIYSTHTPLMLSVLSVVDLHVFLKAGVLTIITPFVFWSVNTLSAASCSHHFSIDEQIQVHYACKAKTKPDNTANARGLCSMAIHQGYFSHTQPIWAKVTFLLPPWML